MILFICQRSFNFFMNESTQTEKQKDGMKKTTTMQFATSIIKELLTKVDPQFGMSHKHQFEMQGGKWDDPFHL